MNALPLSVGVVGAGAIVQKVHLPVLADQPDARVAWISDRDPWLARRVAADFGLRACQTPSDPEHLPACDLVLLATPLFARAAYLQHFAARGTPVFAEKPFAATASEHAQALASFGATPVWCGYMRRGYANLRMLRTAVGAGWFGALRRIRYAEGGRTTGAGTGSPTLDRSWREGGGVLRDLGCHGLDAMQFVSGASAWEIERCAFEWDGATDREARASLRVEGVELDFCVSWLRPQPNSIELHFERASLRCGIKPGTEAEIASTPTFDDALPFRIDSGGARGEYASYHLEWREVLDSLQQRRTSSLSAASSLWTTELVEAMYAAGAAP